MIQLRQAYNKQYKPDSVSSGSFDVPVTRD